MKIESVAVVLYAVWLISEMLILRPARDRNGAIVKDKSMLVLGLSNMGFSVLSIALYFLGIGAAHFGASLQLFGIALMLTGFAVRWAGMWTLKKFFSANVAVQNDHRLVIAGPYRMVRHPGYFGGWLAFVGLGLALGNWIALTLLVVFTVPAFLYRIGVEEKTLRAAFPEYSGYAEKVKKFVPLVW